MLTVKKGQTGQGGVTNVGVDSRRTTPPARYTDGKLLADMEGAAKFIENEALRAALKDSKGIGTPATQAATLETLKDRDYAVVGDKAGRARTIDGDKLGEGLWGLTEKALQIVPVLMGPLTDVATTALWEEMLALIARGKMKKADFMARQVEATRQLVKTGLACTLHLGGQDDRPNVPCATVGCDSGGKLTLLPGKHGDFWSCSLRAEGCTCKFDNVGGKPVLRPEAVEFEPLPGDGDKCPSCKKGNLVTRLVTNNASKAFGKRFLTCSDRGCKGKPVFEN